MDIKAIWNTLDMVSDTLAQAQLEGITSPDDLLDPDFTPSPTQQIIDKAMKQIEGLMSEIEGEAESTYEGIPSVSVNYADGSSMRITGHFDQSTVADVARLIRYRSAEEINDD